jgi:hypothetical protein
MIMTGAVVLGAATLLCSLAWRAPDAPEAAERLAVLLMAWAAAKREQRTTFARVRKMDIRMVDPEDGGSGQNKTLASRSGNSGE